ncbi:MAG: hypothetical protein JSR89_02795 [Proteobacteria bacterium]|nr:hypothetical protein [Pseudomonadota bacterium]
MKSSRVLIVAASAVAASFAVACNAFAAELGTPASVLAMNQKPKGDSVSITYVFVPKDGILAVYSGDPANRSHAKLLGKAALPHGDHRNVSIKLAGEPKAGEKLWAVIEGTSGNAFTNADGPAEQSFKVL